MKPYDLRVIVILCLSFFSYQVLAGKPPRYYYQYVNGKYRYVPVSYRPRCGTGQYVCGNGHCIHVQYVCDGHDDCGDRSDEERSTSCQRRRQSRCSAGQFQCKNRHCVHVSRLCDRRNDCGDFSDEYRPDCLAARTPAKTIQAIRTTITTTPTIPSTTKTTITTTPTIPSTTKTTITTTPTIPSTTKTTTKPTIRSTTITTTERVITMPITTTRPIITTKEVVPSTSAKPSSTLHPRPAYTYPPVCSKNQFKCRVNSVCISRRDACDGMAHCVDGSDELDEACDLVANDKRDPAAASGSIVSVVSQTGFGAKTINYIRSARTNCLMDEFECSNKKCVKRFVLCDGDDDCSDGSDEGKMCDTINRCQADQFKCDSGTCILRSFACDGQFDCNDKSDEGTACYTTIPPTTTTPIPTTTLSSRYNRHSSGCKKNELTCDNGNCVHVLYTCDGSDDCGDWSDEGALAKCHKRSCHPRYQYQCGNGNCVLKGFLCDGDNDCGDSSDEKNCAFLPTTVSAYVGPKKQCAWDLYQCRSGKCIDKLFVCDGNDDCGDRSDENSYARCDSRQCLKEQFTCISDGKCILKAFQCDGDRDCGDGSDEDPTLAGCKKPTCGPNTLQCDNGKCIHETFKCDGENDCGDNSDEQNCEKSKPSCATPANFRCQDGGCIPVKWKCDGFTDCEDKSDERTCS